VSFAPTLKREVVGAPVSLQACHTLYALAVAASPVSARIVDIVATRGLVPPPPRERATRAWAMGKEGGNVRPHARL
jgi:hypothetical protein